MEPKHSHQSVPGGAPGRETKTGAQFEVGDVVQIEKDQYGRPVLAYDPLTGKYNSNELQNFEITSVDGVNIGLRPLYDKTRKVAANPIRWKPPVTRDRHERS